MKSKLVTYSVCIFLLSISSCKHASDSKDLAKESTIYEVPKLPHRDSVEIEKNINALLARMSLKEKIGQMSQISSYPNTKDMIKLIKNGEIGSILNEVDPVRINTLQHAAIEKSRLGIPLLIARDIIHGFKTIFPIPLGQAASFDPDIVEEGARVSALEASSVGIRWTFSPMIDISRDPRWGRMAEGFGEDVYLTSIMGAAMIKGYQGDSLNDATSMAACAKHLIGYGAAEGGRDYNSTFITERRLREVYLPPFEAAKKAGVATFMTAFNDNDGIPSTGNAFVLKEILRKEWGFDGFVVSDWGAVNEMITHGFAANQTEAAMKAVNAGVDMEMVRQLYVKELPELIKKEKVKEATVDEAVRNILRIKYRLGLFDNPYVNEKANVMYAPAHLKVAKRAAIESAILLKNENATLPISSAVKTVAIVGPLADAPHDQLGTWVFDGDDTKTITPLHAIRNLVGNSIHVIYEPGLAYSRDTNKAGITKAVSSAAKADLILAFVGEESILSGEAHCLADLNLQGAQCELIAALAKTGKPIVTIIMAGRPLTIGKEVEESAAVLYSFHPGTMGGPALADLLWGKAVPSGKTPVTFPKMVGQIPLYYAHNNSGRPATKTETLLKDIPIAAGQSSLGCTSFYLDAGFDPLYPFGYGLSYTTFEYSNIKLSSKAVKRDGVLTITFDLKNTGKYEGTEVAQLYVQDKVGSVTRPIKELKRFARISLQPNEKKSVMLTLPIKELAFWNIDMKKTVETGDFGLWIGSDSQSGKEITFKVIE